MVDKILKSKLIMILATASVLAATTMSPYVLVWVLLGIVSHFIMMGYHFQTSRNELNKIKKLYRELGYLPFLRGLLLCLILGPLSLVLFAYFNLTK